MMKKIQLTAIGVLSCLVVTGCVSHSQKPTKPPEKMPIKTQAKTQAKTTATTTEASKFCQSVGGKVKVVDNGKGQFCLLPEGDVVEINRFYRENHKK